MMVLKNVRLFDGLKVGEELMEIAIEGDRIARIAPSGASRVPEGVLAVDLKGAIACPGFVDLHAHLRDPGFTWREDLESGPRAAARGGFAAVVAMPNTDPAVDNPGLIRYVAEKGKAAGGAKVLPAGAITSGRKGTEMVEMGGMAEEGAVIFTDDGSPLSDSSLLRNAMLYAFDLGIRVMEHPEDVSLSRGGCVNEGMASSLSGLKGIPPSAEAIDVFRCVALSRETGCPIHITHISTAASVEIVRRAKAEGVPVTCDVTPHHLTLTEEEVLRSGFDPLFKVNPPLRSRADVEALWEGLADGTVDAIATDHAPYHFDEKDALFEEAPFGIASLECAVAVVFDAWHRRNKPFKLERLLELFSTGPLKVLPSWVGSSFALREGGVANVTVVDLELLAQVDLSRWASKAYSTPWKGAVLKGWPVATVVEGKLVHRRDEE